MKEIDKYNEQHVRQKIFEQPGNEAIKSEFAQKSMFSTPPKNDFTGIILSDSPVKSLRNNYPQSEKKPGKLFQNLISNN